MSSPPSEDKLLELTKWVRRWKVIRAALIFCAIMISILTSSILLQFGPAELSVRLVENFIWSALGIIGGYVFGASWENFKIGQLTR